MNTNNHITDYQKLSAIGLNQSQVRSILQKLSSESIDLFIHKWNEEKIQSISSFVTKQTNKPT